MFLEKVFTGRNQWYFYVISLLIVFVATQVGSIPLVIYMFWNHPGDYLTGNVSLVTTTNLGLALILLSFVAAFFALFLCVKYIHLKSYLDIVTARMRVDWRRMLFAAGIWGGISILTLLPVLLFRDPSEIIFQFEPVNFLILVLIALIMFPFQTSFEELLFRGYLMQWTAFLCKYRWIAILVTGIFFGILHGANPEVEEFGVWVALPQYILMGLILGYVAVMDDGIELAFGLHLANNFITAITFTSDASALRTHALFKDLHPASSYWDSVILLIGGVVFIWICNRKYHFIGKVDLWGKIGK